MVKLMEEEDSGTSLEGFSKLYRLLQKKSEDASLFSGKQEIAHGLNDLV